MIRVSQVLMRSSRVKCKFRKKFKISGIMKTFNTLKGQLRFIGTLQPSTKHQWIQFSLSNCVFFAICIFHCSTMFWFSAFEAETFADYSECSFYMLCAVMTFAWYTIMFWQRKEYTNFLAYIDKTIETSKH